MRRMRLDLAQNNNIHIFWQFRIPPNCRLPEQSFHCIIQNSQQVIQTLFSDYLLLSKQKASEFLYLGHRKLVSKNLKFCQSSFCLF
jgi:hypothetical protein